MGCCPHGPMGHCNTGRAPSRRGPGPFCRASRSLTSAVGQSRAGAGGSPALPQCFRMGTSLSPLRLSPAGPLTIAVRHPHRPLTLLAPKPGIRRPAAAGAAGEAARESSAGVTQGLADPSNSSRRPLVAACSRDWSRHRPMVPRDAAHLRSMPPCPVPCASPL